MADSTLTPGKATSEFSLTKWVMLVGTVVTALSAIAAALPGIGVGQRWVAVALAGLGMATKVLALLGYQNGRTALKQAELDAAASRGQAAAAVVQNASEAVDVIKGVLNAPK